MRKVILGCAVMASVILSPRSEAHPSGAISIMYSISAPARQEVGVASWYGEKFQGNPTASGELFDMNGLTAAHRLLPMGTKVKVTNLLNSKSVMVRINDRGPAIRGRLIDISKGAARAIGLLGLGLAPVQLEIVSTPEPTLLPSQSQAAPAFSRAAF